MTNQYFGFTIGPIFSTITSARSTRAVFNASYIFSWLSREIIKDFANKKQYQDPGYLPGESILVPYVDLVGFMFNPGNKAGLFHDRMICRSNDVESDWQLLIESITSVIDRLAINIINDLKASRQITEILDEGSDRYNELIGFLRQYIRIYAGSVPLDNNQNPLKEVDDALNSFELRPNNLGHQNSELFYQWLELKFERGFRHFTFKDANGSGEGRFGSVAEVALGEHAEALFRVSSDRYWKVFNAPKDADIYDLFNSEMEFSALLRHHKYFVVLRADADHLGKAIGNLFDSRKDSHSNPFSDLSALLLQFSKQATADISAWGGMPIFAGGDDVLCFAPVVSNGKTIFDLCLKLDSLFNSLLKSNDDLYRIINKSENALRLSFGISIGYYKHPMSELINDSYHQLIEAKKVRNAIGISVLKHSGTRFSSILQKPLDQPNNSGIVQTGDLVEGLKSAFRRNGFAGVADLLRNGLDFTGNNDTNQFLSGLQFKLRLLEPILTESILSDTNRLKATMENFFNEDIHIRQKDFLQVVRVLLELAYKDSSAPGFNLPRRDKGSATPAAFAIDQVYFLLRFIQFTIQKMEATDE